jgi:amino acid transporter
MVFFLIGVSVYSLCTRGINISPAFASAKFTLENVINAAGVGVFLYVGFEWVTPLAEETTDYRLIGRGMLWSIGLLSITYCLFTVGMYVGLTDEQLRSGSPIPHILFGQNLFGGAGVLFFIIMSVLASVTSFNAGLVNTSRFAYAMGRDNVLPRVFSRLHSLYATPWVAIIFLALFAIAISVYTLLTGQYLFIIMMAAALECFIYVVMAVCVIRLRKKQPDAARDFKTPLGYTVPVITIIVFLGLLIGIFTDSSRDYSGKVLFHNYWVAVVMAAFFALTAGYTLIIVPMLKKKASERAQGRVKRRPGRT